jgi:ubiquinone/menaquinone biosynthesis C-methylase UbiE
MLYPKEPSDPVRFTARANRAYSMFARTYDRVVRLWPTWSRWLDAALPHIQGPRVLEVSFGTGYLLTQYAAEHEVTGIDLNARLAAMAKRKLAENGMHPSLARANVEALPFRAGHFDTVVNTMAMSAYPDGEAAIGEMGRVLRPGGRLVLIDVNYPIPPTLAGRFVAWGWRAAGDVFRDIDGLLRNSGFTHTTREIGGCGTVHLYVAKKNSA